MLDFVRYANTYSTSAPRFVLPFNSSFYSTEGKEEKIVISAMSPLQNLLSPIVPRKKGGGGRFRMCLIAETAIFILFSDSIVWKNQHFSCIPGTKWLHPPPFVPRKKRRRNKCFEAMSKKVLVKGKRAPASVSPFSSGGRKEYEEGFEAPS